MTSRCDLFCFSSYISGLRFKKSGLDTLLARRLLETQDIPLVNNGEIIVGSVAYTHWELSAFRSTLLGTQEFHWFHCFTGYWRKKRRQHKFDTWYVLDYLFWSIFVRKLILYSGTSEPLLNTEVTTVGGVGQTNWEVLLFRPDLSPKHWRNCSSRLGLVQKKRGPHKLGVTWD